MHKNFERTIEIAVEVGKSESLLSAIEAGADDVVIELEGTVPYRSAHAFSISDYAKIFELTHSHEINLCLSMDWAYKDSEIRELAKTFEKISRYLPQRVIVADFGVARFISQNYPIAISAGSLLSAHNLASVSFLKRQNFSRVRLNPFLTGRDLAMIAQRANCELSIQAHGDLCFSFRELCYASSFFANRSALRQACQPICRRPYMANGKLGYWLSTRDLELIEQLDWLRELSIKELLISGFSRPAEYVYRTVKAYRMVRDAKRAELTNAIEAAKKILAFDLGRSKTQALLGDLDKSYIIDPARPPIAGLLIGKIENISNNTATITSASKLNDGDRLKIIGQPFGKGPSFSVHNIKIKGIKEAKYLISFKAPKTVNVGDFVFKISLRPVENLKELSAIAPNNAEVLSKNDKPERSLEEKLEIIYSTLEQFTGSGDVSKKPLYRIEIWGKPKPQVRIPPNAELVVDFREDIDDLNENVRRRTILSLPAVIVESEWQSFQKRVEALLLKGHRRWQIGHFSQLEIFKMAKERGDKLFLTCGSTCNVFNLLCAQTMWSHGVQFINLPYETDCELIKNFSDERWVKRFGVTIYGFVPLMTSRVAAFENASPFSLLGREWSFKVFPKNFTIIRPREPFCAPPSLLKEKLSSFAFLQIQVDSTVAAHLNELQTIFRLVRKAKGIRKASPFNLAKNRRI